jgi:hypothetical protein
MGLERVDEKVTWRGLQAGNLNAGIDLFIAKIEQPGQGVRRGEPWDLLNTL